MSTNKNTSGFWCNLSEEEQAEKFLEIISQDYISSDLELTPEDVSAEQEALTQLGGPIKDLSNIQKEMNNAISLELIKFMKEKHGYNNEAEIRKIVSQLSDKYFSSTMSYGIDCIIYKSIDAIKTSEIKGWVERFKEWMKKWGYGKN